jgi:hypothetical protein
MSHYPSSFLKSIAIHPSWEEFFQHSSIQEELMKIEKHMGHHYVPQTDKVLL